MQIDLLNLAIKRPEKIRWQYQLSQSDPLTTLRSKTLTTFLSQTDQLLSKFNISYEHVELNEYTYSEWWHHYQHQMITKGYDVIAQPDWFQKKIAEGKKVSGYFYYHSDTLIGTLIYHEYQKNIHAAYKTNNDVSGLSKKHRSLGAIIDYNFLRDQITKHPNQLSLGSMRNAYGVINTLGNLEYKLSMGYQPVPKEETEYFDFVPVNDEGRVAFFGYQNEQLTLFLLQKSDDSFGFNLERFSHDKMAVVNLKY